jgi:uncharacterized phage infection (PIP) family protein YhgE
MTIDDVVAAARVANQKIDRATDTIGTQIGTIKTAAATVGRPLTVEETTTITRLNAASEALDDLSETLNANTIQALNDNARAKAYTDELEGAIGDLKTNVETINSVAETVQSITDALTTAANVVKLLTDIFAL